MASSGINNGTLTALYVEANGGGLTKVAELTNTEFSAEMATRDASTKDSGGWQDVLEGQKSWTMSADGYFAEDAAFGFTDLFTEWTNRRQVIVAFSSAVNDDKRYKGFAYITSLSRSAPTEDSETFSVSLQGTGTISQFNVS